MEIVFSLYPLLESDEGETWTPEEVSKTTWDAQ